MDLKPWDCNPDCSGKNPDLSGWTKGRVYLLLPWLSPGFLGLGWPRDGFPPLLGAEAPARLATFPSICLFKILLDVTLVQDDDELLYIQRRKVKSMMCPMICMISKHLQIIPFPP